AMRNQPRTIVNGKRKKASGAVVMVALLGALAVWTPARAGVGLAVIADFPSHVYVGAGQLNGSISISNANSDRDLASTNLVFDIALAPSGVPGFQSAEGRAGFEDPGVIGLGSTAMGRAGTACAGTVFAVKLRNAATGQVTFDAPEGFVELGSP